MIDFKKRVRELETEAKQREERMNGLTKTIAEQLEELLSRKTEIEKLKARIAELEAKELIGQ